MAKDIATEFFVEYGWAILAAIVAIAVLIYYGYLDSTVQPTQNQSELVQDLTIQKCINITFSSDNPMTSFNSTQMKDSLNNCTIKLECK